MEVRCRDSDDPTGKAIDLAVEHASGPTPRRPFGPLEFWEILKSEGFYCVDGNPLRPVPHGIATDGWGCFFALIILNHAFGKRLINGDTVKQIYWMKGMLDDQTIPETAPKGPSNII